MADTVNLTGKQEAFCNEYLVDLNGTQAAIRAGYSEDSAANIAYENMRKPEISARIAELRDQMGRGFNITRERIAQEYARIAFFDIRKIYDGEQLKPLEQISDDEAAAIGGVKRAVTTFGDEDNGGEKVSVEVKIWDKRAALDSLVKLMGFAAPDKIDHTTAGQPITTVKIIRDTTSRITPGDFTPQSAGGTESTDAV